MYEHESFLYVSIIGNNQIYILDRHDDNKLIEPFISKEENTNSDGLILMNNIPVYGLYTPKSEYYKNK